MVHVCLNGHEWAKQPLRQVGIGFRSLDNGFLACDDPTRLQAICDGLGPADVQRFFDRWVAHLPWPLTAADQAAGYQHRLSIRQLEVSRTQVFDHPVQGRHFFEAVIRDNLDLGRPDRVSLLFPTRLTRRTPPPASGFRNRDLRPHVAALLGRDLTTYSRGAMTYDLRRLRLHGLIERGARTQRYTLTSFGLRVAFFCSKVHLRILRSGSAALVDPPDHLPHPLRDALRRLDLAIDQLCAAAQLHPDAA